jgi:hypothetical protein
MAKKVFIAGTAATRHITTAGATIGASPVALSANTRNLSDGVQIVCSTANTNSIWISTRSNVTADISDTSGVEIVPGASLMVPVTKESDLYLVSDAAGQTITYISF